MTIEHKQEAERTLTETVLVVVGVVLFLIFITLPSGCASHGMVSVTGPEVAAPEGYIYYCRRNPTADECSK